MYPLGETTMKWIIDWSSVFIKRLWRKWGTQGKRMTLHQAIVYAEVVADTLEECR